METTWKELRTHRLSTQRRQTHITTTNRQKWFKYTQIQRQSVRSGNTKVTQLKLIRDKTKTKDKKT